MNIGWGLTSKCNSKCKHCYNASGMQEFKGISFEEAKTIVDKLANNGIETINYGTGESGLIGYFWDLVEYTYNKGIIQGLTTNGSSINKNTIGFVKKYMNDIDVSLDYPDEEDDNDFRGSEKAWEWAINACNLLKENEITGDELIRRGDILISLATGSINEAERLGLGVPDNILDQIKRKIILFDGEQTKFIFDEPKKKRITIQGLAGTGKTELLLHKIKELYTDDNECRIVFTCHNVILADSLRKRVPEFFNFMKVEEQIQWEKRLWVMRSWGSYGNPDSGVYSYICNHYHIPFSRFSYNRLFDTICREALSRLNQIEDFQSCFDYILIDESQDFSEGFFALCEKVAKKCVYVAGDIFQDIFENKSLTVVNPDFLLNKCYRTDPRTLMGAHAIGMGLFEKKLRWLKDDEWEACGYDVKREGKNIIS